MTERDSLAPIMGDGARGPGLEAEAALARLRRGMFAATDASVSVGRYLDLEEIGRGGMGVVYRGRDGAIGRRVAIKVLHGGDPRQQQRLRREARAMARLSHPNVVQVLEVGRHHEELYVAMELVEGRDLATWLRTEPRSWRAIVDVFLAAGEGLAAAHAEGLVHRDFKPSNVLVGDDGRVRVSDFGLASVEGVPTPTQGGSPVGDEGSDDALTATGARLGTPRYMAPEQRRGTQVDHLADQWSFAASLWESLYDQHPLAGPDGRLDPQRRFPAPPRSERGTPRAIGRVLRRALEPDPEDRHPSMVALLDRLRSAARGRARRVAVGAAALVLLGGAAWLGAGPSAPLRRCDPQEHSDPLWNPARQAAVERAFADSGLPFAAKASADARARLGTWVRDWNDAYRQACEATPHDQAPDASTELRLRCLRAELVEAEGLVGVLETADRSVVLRAEAATRQLPDHGDCLAPPVVDVDPQVLAAHTERMASIRGQVLAGSYREAAERSEQALAQTTEAALRAEVELAIGLNRRRSGDFERAGEPMRSAFYDAAQHEDAHLAAEAAVALAQLAIGRSELEDAETWLRHAGTWIERVEDPTERRELERERGVTEGELRYDQGRYDDAIARLDEVWDQCDHDESLAIVPRLLNQRGLVHMARGDYDDAERWFRRAGELEAARSGPTHPQVSHALENLGSVAWYRGDYETAARHYREALEIRTVALGPDNPKTATTVMNLGLVAHSHGDYEEAVARLEQAIAAFTAAHGRDHARTALAVGNLAATLSAMGRWDESNERNRESLEIYETVLGPEHPSVANTLLNLAAGMTETDRYDEALALYQRALDIAAKTSGTSHPMYAAGLHNMAVVLRRKADFDGAERRDREALAIYEAALGPEHPELALVLVGLAQNALAQERWADAVQTAERARTIGSTFAVDRGLAAFFLAQALWETRTRDRVPELLAEAERELRAAGPNGEDRLDSLHAWEAAHGLPGAPPARSTRP